MTLKMTWPKDKIFRPLNSSKFRLLPITKSSVSPYTRASKVLLGDEVWHASLDFTSRNLADGITIQNFIDNLDGGANPVDLFDPWRYRPQLLSTTQTGFSDGTLFDDGSGFLDGYSATVLNAAVMGANQIALQGLPVNKAAFTGGDLISINGYLYQLRGGASSNAAGQCMVWIRPGLRAAIAAGDAVVCDYPTASMILLDAANAIVPRVENHTGPFTLEFVENIA